MRLLAIGLALACAAALSAATTTPADAIICYTPKAIALTKTPMSKLPPPQACFQGHVEQINGIAYCVSCGMKGIEVAPGKCVASCKSGYIFNPELKRCCQGKPTPPFVPR